MVKLILIDLNDSRSRRQLNRRERQPRLVSLQIVEDRPRRSTRSNFFCSIFVQFDVFDELVRADVVVVQVAVDKLEFFIILLEE